MQLLFVSIYDFFEKRKLLCYATAILLFLLCIAGASTIRLEQDINKMIPNDASVSALTDVLNKTKASEQIVFSISLADTALAIPDSLIAVQEEFEQALSAVGGQAIEKIDAQVNDEREQQFLNVVPDYLPIFLAEADYIKLDSLCQSENILHNLERQHKLLLSPAGAVAAQWLPNDPLALFPIAFQKLQSLQADTNYHLYNGYILSKDERFLTFFVTLKHPASETGKHALLFQEIDKLIAAWKVKYPTVQLSYFGGPAVAAENATQMRADTIVTLSVTIVLLLALTFYVFKRKRSSILLMLPVLFGAAFGLAVCAWVQGSISVIALGAGAIILGIAIDFSVHFMSHARNHTHMRDNVKSLAMPLTLGAITTIGAFFALTFAKAPLLHDLGLMAAASLTGASLFTLIFLPHFYKPAATKLPTATVIDKVAAYKPEGNKWLLLVVIVATPVLWFFAKDVQFDADLMHLNYLSPKLQKAQDDLNSRNDYALSAMYVVAGGNDLESAQQRLEQAMPVLQRLQQQNAIRSFVNPALILPSVDEQQKRLQRWQSFWTNDRKTSVVQAVEIAAAKVGFANDAFLPFQQRLNEGYTLLDEQATEFLTQFVPNAYSATAKNAYAIASVKVAPGMRNTVLAAMNNQSQLTVTDRQLATERLLALLNQDFNQLLLLSGILVFVALLIAYGRIELALISFLPMAITWVWILGFMSIFGLQFNVVNIIIATLIFGLGDDYSIFMMDSLMERYRTGKSHITQSRSAVYLSVITTVIGLGTLLLAKHPALHSIAVVAILGLLCVVFVSQVLQPFLFNFFIQHRADKGFMPFTLWSFAKSVFAFVYFFAGCIIVTIAGFILIGLRPLGKARSKFVFHWLLSKYTGSVMYLMANVRKRILVDKALFDTPKVFIANHASFLDILLVTMLHPKLVLLTNKWVWRSPVFGKIVRMAEYYPVADGAEDSLAPLQGLVNRGYSIFVFPEGTRSYDDTIQRFHKGAFYIAEKLKLDIVPIVMHGVHYTMQKGDFLLKDGICTLQSLPIVSVANQDFAEGFSLRSKQVSKLFRTQFEQIKVAQETPSYFKEQLIKSYLYKGPVLEWYCRVKIALEKYYEPFHALLPKAGNMYDLGCGYGFMTYMLHWASEQRIFTGVDYDEDKIITAQEVYLREKERKLSMRKGKEDAALNPIIQAKIHFESADVNQYELKSCTAIIISDVLHYLLPQQQLALLNKCYQALEPGGRLIIRDGVEDLAQRHQGTRRTEKWSTQIIGFNKTQNELHFINRSFVTEWAVNNNMQLQVIDNTKNTSNLIFVLDKIWV